MKLYYSKGACSLAVRITLHEIGIPCEFESVDLKTKQTQTGSDHLKTNPKGAVPALALDDGTVLTENIVIQQYLAEKYQAHQLLPTPENFNRYRVLEWLSFVATDLHKNCTPFFIPQISEETKEIYKKFLKNKLAFVDQHLSHHTYLAGDHFTLPDSYLFVVLRWMSHIGISVAEYKNLSRFFDEVKNRKAVKQALEEEGL